MIVIVQSKSPSVEFQLDAQSLTWEPSQKQEQRKKKLQIKESFSWALALFELIVGDRLETCAVLQFNFQEDDGEHVQHQHNCHTHLSQENLINS